MELNSICMEKVTKHQEEIPVIYTSSSLLKKNVIALTKESTKMTYYTLINVVSSMWSNVSLSVWKLSAETI